MASILRGHVHYWNQRLVLPTQRYRYGVSPVGSQLDVCTMNPRDNLKKLDTVIMLLTMVGMALAAFKTVVTVIALYMLATLDIRKNMT